MGWNPFWPRKSSWGFWPAAAAEVRSRGLFRWAFAGRPDERRADHTGEGEGRRGREAGHRTRRVASASPAVCGRPVVRRALSARESPPKEESQRRPP
eukprot:gene12429-biopygen6465